MTEMEMKIMDARIEISLAIGCLEWARGMVSKQYCAPFLSGHICGRIDGLEKALNTLKELDAIVHKEQADVHGPGKD